MIFKGNPCFSILYFLSFFWSQNLVFAQEQISDQSKFPILDNVLAACIGPTVQGGRVTDIDVNPNDPTEFFIAYASGGLWHTLDNGISFAPLFQEEQVMTIGDIAVNWSQGIIFIGTGEQNSSRSSYAGKGVYKSTDMGKTWMHLGLDDTHHISRILVHPTNPEVVFVAALGHLYTSNSERGVYKSNNGGKSWDKVLFVNDSTGVIDLVFHPSNPDIILAASWEKMRKAWNFDGSGSASNIYMSKDGGDAWEVISKDNSGFPQGDGKGRIGLDLAFSNDTTYIYAIVDNNHRRPKDDKKPKRIKGFDNAMLKSMTEDDFLKYSDDDIKNYLSENGFHKKYTPDLIRKLFKNKEISLRDIYSYNDNANTNLFDTPVIGAEVYRSNDFGKTWIKTHKNYLDGVYYSYGYYFGRIHVHPTNPMKLYIYGVPLLTSDNGGESWQSIDADNLHVDHHALWINKQKKGHIISGNDGGLNISYDDGKHWKKCNQPAVGQFYAVEVDNQEHYQVYAGAQDNGVWNGPHTYEFSRGWESTGHYPYKMLLGGDGMQIQVDDTNPNLIYTGYQFGNYFRIDKSTNKRDYVTPKHELGQQPYRWNWQTPILLSPHNADILYMGSQKVMRSMNKGDTFEAISPDLTHGEVQGNVPFGTITTMDESVLKFGLLYVGTDDGNVYITQDGGNDWSSVGIPVTGKWISRVQASSHEKKRAYVSANGYRDDDFMPYLYSTEDYGQHWNRIGDGLPNAPINVVKEDPQYSDILYVGNDLGLYISLDKGAHFTPLAAQNFPNTPVHDLVIQDKNHHLIVGTHGRSLWKIDLSALYSLKETGRKPLDIVRIENPKYSERWGSIENFFTPIDTGFVHLQVYTDKGGDATFTIFNHQKNAIAHGSIMLKPGLSDYRIPLRVDDRQINAFLKSVKDAEWYKKLNFEFAKADDGFYYLTPGNYQIKLAMENHSADKSFEVTIK